MKMLARHTPRSLRYETPKNLDVLPRADDVFRFCSCLVAKRKLQNLLSVLTPLMWSTDNDGHSPVSIAHAARCASKGTLHTMPVKYPCVESLVNAFVPAYLVFHRFAECAAFHFTPSEKWLSGRSNQENFPVSRSYETASIRVEVDILDIPKQYQRKNGLSTNTKGCPCFKVSEWLTGGRTQPPRPNTVATRPKPQVAASEPAQRPVEGFLARILRLFRGDA